MKVVIAADHAGLPLRATLAEAVEAAGHEAVLMGPDDGKPVDYPDVAEIVCAEVASARADRGILLCGSGAGVSIAANKCPGVRAAIAHDTYTAHQMVEHDMVNILTIGARVIGPEPAKEIVTAFVSAKFSGVDRHRRRLNKVLAIERDEINNPLHQLHNVGQSVWMDNIRRDILDKGILAHYIDRLAITGLTSNPAIFDKAIADSNLYDSAIQSLMKSGTTDPEAIFFDLAIEDLSRAAELFRPTYEGTNTVDGYVSLEVSPLLANDTASTVEQGKALFARAGQPNLFIKVPGTPEGCKAIEQLIHAGVNINVTLLFSVDHYKKAADAYMRGLELRLKDGLDLNVASVGSVFISRWDKAANPKLPEEMHNKLGVAIGEACYRAYCEMVASDRWKKLAEHGGNPQRLLMASTSAKDPSLPSGYYVTALAAPNTVNTIPEATLTEFGETGKVEGVLSPDGGDCDATMAALEKAGIDIHALGEQLQIEGRDSFNESWDDLIKAIKSKGAALAATA